MTWALLTGEYPPQRGGVADYTYLLARALGAHGDAVHVFAPPCGGAREQLPGVIVHELPDHYGRRGRSELRRSLAALPKPRAAVLQYVPQSFGMRGCNVPFARWLNHLTGYPLFVMFHEVSVTVGPDTPWKYRLQALATRVMARTAIAAADAMFVSTPVWSSRIGALQPSRTTIDWTPVPSNIALSSDPDAVASIRAGAASKTGLLFGHFGTFREAFARKVLLDIVPRLLRNERRMLFMGRGSEQFVEELCATHPQLRGRIDGTGGLPAQQLADHIATCDLLVQPYEDGVSARRGSVTAALALGVPVVTMEGSSTESIWQRSGAVGLAPAGSHDALVLAVERLAKDGAARAAMAVTSRALYAEQFSIEHTVSALRKREAGR